MSLAEYEAAMAGERGALCAARACTPRIWWSGAGPDTLTSFQVSATHYSWSAGTSALGPDTLTAFSARGGGGRTPTQPRAGTSPIGPAPPTVGFPTRQQLARPWRLGSPLALERLYDLRKGVGGISGPTGGMSAPRSSGGVPGGLALLPG